MDYDQKPKAELDSQGNGYVTIFSQGQELYYSVVHWTKIKFVPRKSGRCDGGVDGADSVWPSLRQQGYKCAAEIAKATKNKVQKGAKGATIKTQ